MPKAKPKIEQKCTWCETVYFRCPSHANRGENNFCSRSCKSRWIGKKLSQDQDYKDHQRDLIKAKGNKPPLHLGENHWNWKGGISSYSRGQDYLYVQWRKDVLRNANYTCQLCSTRGGELSAHHIKEWAKFPELRYEISNGQCLHYDCHMEIHGLRSSGYAT